MAGYRSKEGSASPDESRNKVLRRIDEAAKARKSDGVDETWSKLIKLYSLKYDYPEIAAMYDDVVAPNIAFSNVNVVIPSVAVNYPKITVTAQKEQDAPRAETVEAVSNYMWRKWDTHDEFRRAITDSVIIGIGWLKTTWEYKVVEESMTKEEYQLQAQEALMEWQYGIEQGVAAGLSEADFPSEEDVISGLPTKKTVVKADRPVVMRTSPFDVIVDPDATRMSEVRWIAHKMYVPVETVKADKRYNAKARLDVKGTSMREAKKDVDILGDQESRSNDPDFVVVYEYYDILKEEVCTLAEGCNGYLIDPAKIPYALGQPFLPVLGYVVPDKFYPVGDVESMFGLQEELALLRTQMMNDRKRFMRKSFIRKEALSASGLAALRSPHDNEFVEVVDDRPFSDIISPITHQPFTPEAYNHSSMIMDDIDVVTGVTEYQRGSVSEIRRTATEAGLLQDGANARAADKLARIEKTIGEVAQRVVALCQQFLSTEQVAKVVDEEGAASWIPYTADDIQGEYDFMVEAGSTQPMNESFRRQSAMQLMDAMAPLISMGVVNPMALADHVLRNGFGVKDTSKFIMAPPPMMPMEGAEEPQPEPSGE